MSAAHSAFALKMDRILGKSFLAQVRLLYRFAVLAFVPYMSPEVEAPRLQSLRYRSLPFLVPLAMTKLSDFGLVKTLVVDRSSDLTKTSRVLTNIEADSTDNVEILDHDQCCR